MCSVNHDLKAIFIHVHKTGGTYVSYMLHKYYGFKNYYLRRPDHDIFCFNKEKKTKYLNYENRIHGVLTYYKTSQYINKKMNMTPHKWDDYYKFCFIRNPYDKIISAWNHVDRFKIPFKNYLNLTKKCNDVEYMHVFLPQVRNIINEKGKININYIGKFENLEEDFQTILKNIGIQNITHDVQKKMNKRQHEEFYKYYDQETLNKVNILLKEDFNNLDYPIIYNINDFQEKFDYIPKLNDIICSNINNNDYNNNEINDNIEINDNNIMNNNDEMNDNIEINNNNEINDNNEINNNNEINDNKLCCIYAYYEKDNNYKHNFRYFLENAILENVDYYIIINGKCTIQIPIKPNINIYIRQNKGYDFGAYSFALKKINKIYDYYFFMNTSVLGPLKNNISWTTNFLNLFKEDVKIVGTSINMYEKNYVGKYNLYEIYKKNAPYSHVQSMFFVLKKDYLEYLNSVNFFNEELINKINDFHYIIAYKEIGLSQIALNNGWNINCILDKYKDLDYRILKHNVNPNSKNGDPYYNNTFFGENIKKEDVIFYKINRFI